MKLNLIHLHYSWCKINMLVPNTGIKVKFDHTAWKVSKYGPEITSYLDNFHAVSMLYLFLLYITSSLFIYHSFMPARNRLIRQYSQLTFTCSKSTTETLEKGVKYVHKVNNKNIITTKMTSFWCFYCQLWTYSTLIVPII